MYLLSRSIANSTLTSPRNLSTAAAQSVAVEAVPAHHGHHASTVLNYPWPLAVVYQEACDHLSLYIEAVVTYQLTCCVIASIWNLALRTCSAS